MERRSFFKLGIMASMGLGVVRIGYGPLFSNSISPDLEHSYLFLKPEDQILCFALAPVILLGALPDGRESLENVVRGLDKAISGLSLENQNELRNLFTLLHINSFKYLFTGIYKHWNETSLTSLEIFLKKWRYNRIPILRMAYQSIVELFVSSWYAREESWKLIGYDGPPEI